jgi:hypothetical protein
LAGLRARFARRPAVGAPPPSFAVQPPSPAAATIRQLYRDLLRLAAARGAPRRADATPHEHLPRLQATLGPDDALTDLTGAYARARYGALPPDPDLLERLSAWWEHRRREPGTAPERAARRSAE